MSTTPAGRAAPSPTTDAPALQKALSSTPRPPRASARAAVMTFGWRGMLKVKHVPEQLLDVTSVWETKHKAMESMEAQTHLWEYYTDLGKRRGTQAVRNGGDKSIRYAEAFQRVYPQVTGELS